jgi:predicted Zn-dependent protease
MKAGDGEIQFCARACCCVQLGIQYRPLRSSQMHRNLFHFLPIQALRRTVRLAGLLPRWLKLCLLLTVFGPGQALADDYDDVANHIRNGRHVEALVQVEQFLQTRPRDAQMRFFKGMIERDTGKLTSAQTTFLGLTQDYPELPEPHNNLAVVYAAQNQLELARASLETALRANPADTVAQENLGDVLARLAAASWAKALAAEPSSAELARKSKLIRALIAPEAAPAVAPAALPVPARAVAPAPSGPQSR